jgi:hypothetical protein
MTEPNFRSPVFIRNDDTTEIVASVIVWNREGAGVSVNLSNGNESVLINAVDWATLVGCINRELDRVS